MCYPCDMCQAVAQAWVEALPRQDSRGSWNMPDKRTEALLAQNFRLRAEASGVCRTPLWCVAQRSEWLVLSSVKLALVPACADSGSTQLLRHAQLLAIFLEMRACRA